MADDLDPRDEVPRSPQRRTMLRRIGLTGAALCGLPLLTLPKAARADDDDDGGDAAGDDGGGGPDRSEAGDRSGNAARRSTRQTGGPRRQERRAPARRASAPPPELVMLLPVSATPPILAAAGYRVIASVPGPFPGSALLRLNLPSGRTVAAARLELETLVPGAAADENHLYSPDELLCTGDDCAAHAMIGWSGWPSAWAPRIGMIDTGVNVDHDALRGQRLTVHQIPLDDRNAAGRAHGTAVAAMLIGRIGGRVPGLLPQAELIAVEAFHVVGGAEAADAFSLAQAIQRLIAEKVSVINLSFSGPENAVLRRFVQEADLAGIGLVAAAGNNGPGAPPAYPAAWPEVVAVGAVDAGLRPYRQGNRGPYVTLTAPGVNLWTAASISGGRLRSGTSFAAPFVTATMAVERMRHPDATVPEVVAAMIGCARDLGDAGFDEVFGHGLVTAPSQCSAGQDAAQYLTNGN